MDIQRIYLYYIFQFQTTCLVVLHRTKLWDNSAEIIAVCISELPWVQFWYFIKRCFLKSYLGKSYICTVCPRPPLLQLNLSGQALWWSSLVRDPVDRSKWVEILLLSPCLHNANSEIFGTDIFSPGSHCVVDCYGIVKFHVINGDLNMNLFVRIEAVWRKSDCFAVGIGPFWNMEEFYAASNNWKTWQTMKRA